MTGKTAAQLVSEAKSGIENLTPEDLSSELASGPLLLVDIREPAERTASGSIPGAVHAPRGMIEFFADPTSGYYRNEFDPARRTILFCTSGGRSALATRTLQDLGYANVAHLDKGLKSWIEAGLPVEQPAS